jgi:hypothetical protein
MAKSKRKSIVRREEEQVRKIRDTYSQKYPVVFAVGATFGLVAVLYGFEKLIDRNQLFVENPWFLLILGLVILAITGSFYNKLR